MASEKIQPKVFIIILNYNGGERLRNCLASVFGITYPNFSVVVVDNASTDDSFRQVQKNFPDAIAIANRQNLGFAGGNNVGITCAMARQADYILLLNQDTEVESDFLEKLIETAENNPKIGIISPLIFWKKTKQVWFSGGKIKWLTMKAINENEMRSGKYYASGFITGCSMLIKRTVVEKIGPLDDNFFLYYEDADFSCRVRRAGFLTVVEPSSHIYHFETSGPAVGDKLYHLVFSGLRFFEKNSSVGVKIWISFYYALRKLKNRMDMTLRPNDNARVVQKAYYDFAKRKQ